MRLARPIRHEEAFTRTELLVVIGVVALLAALLIPALQKARQKAQRIRCVNFLVQINQAFHIFAADHGGLFPMQFYTNQAGGSLWADATNGFRYFQAVSNELSTPIVLHCPADRQRSGATNFGPGMSNANVSYFVSLNADQSNPNLFLVGDSQD